MEDFSYTIQCARVRMGKPSFALFYISIPSLFISPPAPLRPLLFFSPYCFYKRSLFPTFPETTIAAITVMSPPRHSNALALMMVLLPTMALAMMTAVLMILLRTSTIAVKDRVLQVVTVNAGIARTGPMAANNAFRADLAGTKMTLQRPHGQRSQPRPPQRQLQQPLRQPQQPRGRPQHPLRQRQRPPRRRQPEQRKREQRKLRRPHVPKSS